MQAKHMAQCWGEEGVDADGLAEHQDKERERGRERSRA